MSLATDAGSIRGTPIENSSMKVVQKVRECAKSFSEADPATKRLIALAALVVIGFLLNSEAVRDWIKFNFY